MITFTHPNHTTHSLFAYMYKHQRIAANTPLLTLNATDTQGIYLDDVQVGHMRVKTIHLDKDGLITDRATSSRLLGCVYDSIILDTDVISNDDVLMAFSATAPNTVLVVPAMDIYEKLYPPYGLLMEDKDGFGNCSPQNFVDHPGMGYPPTQCVILPRLHMVKPNLIQVAVANALRG